MLSHQDGCTQSRSACNDNGHVSAAPRMTSPGFLDILAVAHGGRGLTLTYVVDGVLMISKSAVDSARGLSSSHEPRRRKMGVRRSA
jgi:hypothetical protein